LQAGVQAAAEATGARLISMESVYMFGRPAGRPLTEDRDYQAHTTKKPLRGRIARELHAAHDAGRVAVAIGRAWLLLIPHIVVLASCRWRSSWSA
jgi:hypothetical protein